MDFTNRGSVQPGAPTRVATSNGGSASGSISSSKPSKNSRWKENPTWLRAVWIVLLFSVTILMVAMVTLFYFGGTKEVNHVDSTKQQAVFLTNGQVYFGKIKAINSQFVDLRGIYYLNVNQQVQPNQKDTAQTTEVKLVKLGCELHGPADKMVINREQVSFWENLTEDAQVSKAIAKWVKENPNGQKCTTAATDTNNTTNTTTTTPATSTTKP